MELLGGPQVILPPVAGGLDLLHIPLSDQAVHLIGGVGGREIGEGGELVDGGLVQRPDDLHAEGLHRRQAGLPGLEPGEDGLIKMQLEFGIDPVKAILQHPLLPLPIPN